MSQVQQVKDASDIVQIINERVPLKHTGRNWRGLCPFHGEKTPSFFVSEELQRYKCFGCGETGDVYNFLEKYEGMTFSEALRYLADRSGIKLETFKPSAADKERDQLLEILDLAKEYYHYLLTEHKAGEAARQYLKERGATTESIKTFQLGYSLPGWDGLVKYLHQKKKYPLQKLVEAGLVINSKGRHYDRFRGRIMFPLKNHRGQVVGMSGRQLDPDAKSAKYINTPETTLYHKAQLLYGYSELLQHIRQKNEVIVTEGEFDVISSTQAHVNHIVAIKGSAFTQDHAKYIKRVAEKVLFALDMDSAGVEATRRAIPIAQEENLELRIVKLGELSEEHKKDPDDIARQDPKLWRQKVKESISAYQFLIEAALHEHDAKTPEGKREIVKQLATVIDGIEHEVEKDFYLKKLAEDLGVTQSVVRQDIEQQALKQRRPQSQNQNQQTEQDEVEEKTSRRQRLEKYLWFLLLRAPEEKVVAQAEELNNKLKFEVSKFQLLLTKLAKFAPKYSLENFSKTLPEDMQQLVFDLYLQPTYATGFEEEDWQKEYQQTLKELQKLSVKEQIDEITTELDQLDQKAKKTKDEEERQAELLEKIVTLRSKIKA